MELQNSFPKKQKSIPPAELTLGVCYSIIDLGTQQEQFPGKPVTSSRKLHYSFELPSLPQVVFNPDKGAQPQAIFQEYTASLNEKANLAKVLMSWGKVPMDDLKKVKSEGFADFLKHFLGAPCMINIVHQVAKTAVDETTGQRIVYAKIGQGGVSILPRMPQVPAPKGTINPLIFLDLDKFSWETFDKIPKFTQEKIMKSKEWAGIVVKHPRTTTMAQDLGYVQPPNPATTNNGHHTINGQTFDAKGMLVKPEAAIQPNTSFETEATPPVVSDGQTPMTF